MAAGSYLKLLRDPRWQQKRLRILDRDGWACTTCHDEESTLHVHHKRYKANAKPWDYDASDLTTLCETCHKTATDALATIKRHSAELSSIGASRLAGVAVALHYLEAWEAVGVVEIIDYEMAAGIGHVLGEKPEDVLLWIKGSSIDFGEMGRKRREEADRSLAEYIAPCDADGRRR